MEEKGVEELEDSPSDEETHTVDRVGRIFIWREDRRTQDRVGVNSVKQLLYIKWNDKWVTMSSEARKISLFSSTGSCSTKIPPEFYHHKIGNLLKLKLSEHERPSSAYMLGVFYTTLATKKGP